MNIYKPMINDPMVTENDPDYTIDLTADNPNTDDDQFAWDTQFMPKAFEILEADYPEGNPNEADISNNIKLSNDQKESITRLFAIKMLSIRLQTAIAFDMNLVQYNGCMNKLERHRRMNETIKTIENEVKMIESTINYDNKHTTAFIEEGRQIHIAANNYRMDMLYKQKLNEIQLHLQDKAFKTMTDIHVPIPVQLILGYGPKFNVPIFYGKRNLKRLINDIADFTAYTNLPYTGIHLPDVAEDFLVAEGSRDSLTIEQQSFIRKAYTFTIDFLNKNDNLLVVGTDKSKSTALMNKNEYDTKMRTMLGDGNTYQPLNSSSLSGYKKRNEYLLREAAKYNLVKEADISKILEREQDLPRIYGLLKDHKEGSPLRPVVNTKNTPGYVLAKVFSSLLTPILDKHNFNVKNGQDFIEKLKDVPYIPENIMFTADVGAMFTNIDFNMVNQALTRNYHKVKDITGYEVPLKLLQDISSFVSFHSSEIKYNELIVKQIKGMKMGSPASTVSANLVITHYMDITISNIQRPFALSLYVDDMFLITSQTNADNYKYRFNAINPRLQIELTTENPDETINYLNVLVLRNEAQYLTKWYKKDIASDRILNAASGHPNNVKRNVAIEYVKTMHDLTHPTFHPQIFPDAIRILKNNNYTEAMIHEIIANVKNKNKQETIKQKSPQKVIANSNLPTLYPAAPSGYKALPHIPGVTEIHAKVLNEQQAHLPPAKRVKIAHKPISKLATSIFNEHKYPNFVPAMTSTPNQTRNDSDTTNDINSS